MEIRAFNGLRPTTETVQQVASLPYDVVNRAEALAIGKNNPLSMMHVLRAEIDLPESVDPYADAVYAKARENLQRLLEQGALVRESQPGLYVYQLVRNGRAQTGIVALSRVADYDNGLIKKHEKTRPAKENDRTRLTSTLSANTGPVFLTYRDDTAIDNLCAEITRQTPLFDFTADDGIRHTVWFVPAAQSLRDAFANVPCFYIADGHHRAASATRVGRERREANPQHTGEEDYNAFLSVLFPASQLTVLPYNRIVSGLNGHAPADFLAKVAETLQPLDQPEPSPSSPGVASIYCEGHWRSYALPKDPEADPVSRLDVSILHETVFAPLLGIADQRTDERVDFIGGIKGPETLAAMVDAAPGSVAFSLYPTTVDDLMAIADAGQIMPPKSTWFEPKLRSGLFIHTFEPTANA